MMVEVCSNNVDNWNAKKKKYKSVTEIKYLLYPEDMQIVLIPTYL